MFSNRCRMELVNLTNNNLQSRVKFIYQVIVKSVWKTTEAANICTITVINTVINIVINTVIVLSIKLAQSALFFAG